MATLNPYLKLAAVGVGAILGTGGFGLGAGVAFPLEQALDLLCDKLERRKRAAARKLCECVATELESLKFHEDAGKVESARLTAEALLEQHGLSDDRFAALGLKAEKAAEDVLRNHEFPLTDRAEIRPICRRLLICFYATLPKQPDVLADLTPSIYRAILQNQHAHGATLDRIDGRIEQLPAVLRAEVEAAIAALRVQYEGRVQGLEQQRAVDQQTIRAQNEAIIALAGRAAEPGASPTIGHALEALARGEKDEAKAVFAAIGSRKAEDVARKSDELASDRREAAEAYRHLGALSYFESTAEAIDAYRRAVALDPDDVWTWIFVGRLEMQSGDLNDALEAFERAREVAEAAGQERDLAVAWHEIGVVEQAKGQLSAALEAYGQYHEAAQRLAASDPGNAEWQRDLSVSWNKIGDVRRAQGDLEGAAEAHEQSLAIRQRLAAADPGNAAWQRDLSVSWNKIGDVRRAQGDLEGAAEAYEQSLAIRQRLAAADPGNAQWQYDLGISNERVGDVLVAQGNLGDALDAYQRRHDLITRLAASDPGNAAWQRDLSVSWEKIGDVRVAQGDLAGALQAYEESHAIFGRLAAVDPGNAEWQRDLSLSWNKIGDVRVAQGNLAGTLQAYEDSLAISQRLTASDPGNAEWQRDLIVSHWKLADVLEKHAERRMEARAHWQAALKLARELEQSGRLAPADAWMVDDLERRLAKGAGE